MGERRIKTKVRTKVLIEIIFDGYDISEIRDKYATFELGKLEDEKKRIAMFDEELFKDIEKKIVEFEKLNDISRWSECFKRYENKPEPKIITDTKFVITDFRTGLINDYT